MNLLYGSKSKKAWIWKVLGLSASFALSVTCRNDLLRHNVNLRNVLRTLFDVSRNSLSSPLLSTPSGSWIFRAFLESLYSTFSCQLLVWSSAAPRLTLVWVRRYTVGCRQVFKNAISGSSLNGRRLIRPQGLSLAVLQTKFGLLLGISKHISLSMSRNLTYLVPNDFYSTKFSAFDRL